MSDKVRGAIFNILGDIDGLSVLDAFAGSGAMGFEALSRGARYVIAIDSDRKAADTTQRNVKSLGLAKGMKVIRANASTWSDNNADRSFDLVLLDPPYDNIKLPLLQKLALHTKPGGLVVVSHPPTQEVKLGGALEQVTFKSYGDAVVSVFRRNGRT